MNIIVTGASRGIGKAIACKLAIPGNNLIINCLRNEDMLNDVCKFINANGCNCQTFVGDISDYIVCKSMIDLCYTQYGSVDVLVNNAGISMVGLFQDMNIDEWNKIMSVNLTSVFNTCNVSLPYMISSKSGKIINISSVWGNVGASCEVAYCATKGAINSLTKALAKEVAPSNIQVNAIACGAIDTEMNNHLSEDEKKELAMEIPTGRFGNPEEIADMVQALINSPSYLTGQIITVDGGWT